MHIGVAIFPTHDAIAPALDRYEAAVAEFNGE
jgi:hypothetical protein